jgi:3-hydroxyisobutyrate dehydrogenase
MARIALIGLTDIGQILARKLSSTGHTVQVCPFDGQVLEDVIVGAVALSEVVISLLPSEDHVRALYLSKQGLIARISNAPLIIDCSLISPATAVLAAELARERHLNWLDAPYLGNIEEAQAGRLTFIVGASKAAFSLANPLLQCMGRQIFHAGDSGSGQAARICSNIRQAIIMAATAESLALGVKNGLDPMVLASIMQHSAADRISLSSFTPIRGETDRLQPWGLQVGPLLDDFAIAMNCAQATQAFIPLGAMTRNLYSRHVDNQPSCKKRGYSSIHQLFLEA